MSTENAYLVAYDISSPKRWRRIVKELKRVGERRQLSVFFVVATPDRTKRLRTRLESLIDQETDRLMIVNLGPNANVSRRIVGSAPVAITPLII